MPPPLYEPFPLMVLSLIMSVPPFPMPPPLAAPLLLMVLLWILNAPPL
jgi:hypothetical protein